MADERDTTHGENDALLADDSPRRPQRQLRLHQVLAADASRRQHESRYIVWGIARAQSSDTPGRVSLAALRPHLPWGKRRIQQLLKDDCVYYNIDRRGGYLYYRAPGSIAARLGLNGLGSVTIIPVARFLDSTLRERRALLEAAAVRTDKPISQRALKATLGRSAATQRRYRETGAFGVEAQWAYLPSDLEEGEAGKVGGFETDTGRRIKRIANKHTIQFQRYRRAKPGERRRFRKKSARYPSSKPPMRELGPGPRGYVYLSNFGELDRRWVADQFYIHLKGNKHLAPLTSVHENWTYTSGSQNVEVYVSGYELILSPDYSVILFSPAKAWLSDGTELSGEEVRMLIAHMEDSGWTKRLGSVSASSPVFNCLHGQFGDSLIQRYTRPTEHTPPLRSSLLGRARND